MDTCQQNKDVIRRLIEEVVNTGDFRRLDEFVSPECVETNGPVRIHIGLAGMAEHLRAVRSTFPDLRLTIERQIAEGEWVATQMTIRGTHAGVWLEMKPTGRELVISAVNVDRIVDGRIVEHGGAADMLEALFDAGALQPAERV